MSSKFAALCLAATVLAAPQWSSWHNAVQVTANTGTYTGIINETTPNVRQFRNIPFAVPPTGPRRWLPPTAVSSGAETKYDSTDFPPSCPQYALYNSTASQYIAIVPEWVAAPTKADQYAKTSEDCLSLAVWTPTGADAGANLPVMLFMTGGGCWFNLPPSLLTAHNRRDHRWYRHSLPISTPLGAEDSSAYRCYHQVSWDEHGGRIARKYELTKF